MSCRTTPGMSVPMGLARIDSGLEDDQVQSLIHQLRHEYNDAHAEHSGAQDGRAVPLDLAERWQTLRTHLERTVTAHPRLRPQRRAGMISRVGAADTPPDVSMIYAAERIRTRAIQAARMLEDHLASEGARLGVPDREVQQLYSSGRASAPSGRQEWPTDEERQHWRGLPLDPRTRHGLSTVAERPDNPDGRQELITDHRSPLGSSEEISVAGYHIESQRLEICTTDGMWLNYCNVDHGAAQQIQRGDHPDGVLRQQLQGNRAYQYRDAVQAAAAGLRRRCSDCGQYTGGNHICRLTATSVGEPEPGHDVYLRATTGNRQNLEVSGPDGYPVASLTVDALADVADIMDSANRGELIAIPVLDQHPQQLIGEFSAVLGQDDQVAIFTSRAGCTDPAHQSGARPCPHVQQAGAALREQLMAALRHHREQVAGGTAAALAAEASSSARTQPASAVLRPEAPDRSTFRYSDDPARFASDVRAAMDDPSVPFMAGDPDRAVMYGFGADREFGVELEYDSGQPTLAAQEIGQALYSADFTRTPRMQRYGAAGSTGYVRDLHGGWSFEHDGSVDGEIVTPILSDRPETWARMQEVCGLITGNGGVASGRTGSHISISAADHAGMAARTTRFMRFMHHHQADLQLMATAGHGRGPGYSHPVREPPTQGFNRISDLRRATPRYTYVNVAHIADRSTDLSASASRIEFRLWDGSLDPARIQAQVKMSAALLDYSSQNRSLTFTDPRPEGGQLNPDHRDFAGRTHQVRHLVDELFRRDEDKQQAARLWATGLYNRNGHRDAI